MWQPSLCLFSNKRILIIYIYIYSIDENNTTLTELRAGCIKEFFLGWHSVYENDDSLADSCKEFLLNVCFIDKMMPPQIEFELIKVMLWRNRSLITALQ